jgi:large subunit ribosomal protein L9
MVKRLSVVLNQDVTKLGKLGDLVDVAPGYARNYLIPQGLGVLATPGILKQVEAKKEKERQRLLVLKQEALTHKATLESIKDFSIGKQVGEGNAIFGTVTAQEVVDLVQAKSKLEIDRRGVSLPEIHETGTYKVQLKLHPEVSVEIELKVAAL